VHVDVAPRSANDHHQDRDRHSDRAEACCHLLFAEIGLLFVWLYLGGRKSIQGTLWVEDTDAQGVSLPA
jgi:hypothetical protein